MIHNIVYISAATKPFSHEELMQLLENCKNSNQKNSITGLLMYHDQQFFQVLEGDEVTLEACYAKICADDRHRSIITLQKGTSNQRCFAGWEMAFVELVDASEAFQGQYINLCKLRSHKSFEDLKKDPVISVFARTYLADIEKLRGHLTVDLR